MTRLALLSVLAFSALAVCPPQTRAQARPVAENNVGRTLDDVKPGTKVRVSLADSLDLLEGRLRGFGQTSVMIDVNGSSREIPISSIVRLTESYRDRKRGALAGIVVAVVGVYAWDFFGPHPRYTDQDKRYRENAQALAVSLGAGILVGGGIGWHRWRPINTSGR